MQPVLVKIDVAVVELRRSVRAIYEMAEGGSKVDKALCWVFDFSQPSHGARRDLRFWLPELVARGGADATRHYAYSGFQLEWVLKRILPESRQRFSAGEVGELFQIRHNTRAALLPADTRAGRRAFYWRQTLAEFLQLCWVGRQGIGRPAGQAPCFRGETPGPRSILNHELNHHQPRDRRLDAQPGSKPSAPFVSSALRWQGGSATFL